MEFHYSEVCMPSDQLMNDQYHPEYSQPYILRNEEAEYEIRSTVLVDGGDHYGVSSVVFDKFEELVWMGNQGGHVTSYYGPTMQKYTSFQIHANEEVRDILTVDAGIYCLTKSTLRHQIRRGIPRHTHKSANMTDMQCLFQVNSHKFLMGGHQDKLLELDLNKMAETVIKVPEDGCAVLRSGGGSLVACGSANGMVALRDIRSPGKAEHTFRAHTACLSDLDMQGDQLITCGFTQSGTVPVPENYILVWDVRRMAGTPWSLPAASPLLLHFLPAVSGRAVAVAGDGRVTLLRVNETHAAECQSVFQVDTHSAQCSVMDVSSTSQALVFGDQSGHLHLFSAQHNHEPVFNNFSRVTEFADPPPSLPYASFNDTTFSFSTIPLPPLQSDKWFNELPAEFFKKVYRKPRPIDPEVLKTMKMQGPIGYAPNPRTHLRNQKPYIDDNLEDLLDDKKNESKSSMQPIPKEYLKIDLRYNKHGPNEEIEAMNKTGMPGLEATLPNSYCNAMLQVLYHIPPLKTTLLAHTCAKEFCLSCELGFLFRMLDTSRGAPCQAGNFLRAFRTVPEAAALGLLLPERDARADLAALAQSWNRFILHQIHSEILETRKKEKELTFITQKITPPSPFVNVNNKNGPYEEYRFTELEFLGPPEYDEDGEELRNSKVEVPPKMQPAETNHVQNNENHDTTKKHKDDKEESEISQLFAIGRQQVNKCTKCNKEEERESAVLACALAEWREGFAEALRLALAARRATPAWCEHCARFTHTLQRGRVLRLPPILAINCGTTAHEKAHWTKGVQKDMPETSKRGGSGKPCRYGLHCARPGCRFKHPERPMSSPQSNSVKNSPQENNYVLPHQLSIRLQTDGEVIINEKTDQPELRDKQKKKKEVTKSEEEYTLTSVVLCVEDNPRNLVAYVRVPGADGARWFLFNDLCIAPVSAAEVQCGAWWKSPCVVFYAASAS
ncbi:unnamed protein product, partial [Brenthis ino]